MNEKTNCFGALYPTDVDSVDTARYLHVISGQYNTGVLPSQAQRKQALAFQ